MTLKDFAPISLTALLPNILVVHPSLPVSNPSELIALAKSKPGDLHYSSSGIGSMNFLAAELSKQQTGIQITHIPYQSGAQALTALLGGFVQMVWITAPAIIPHLDKLRLLAVSSEKRLPTLPQVPTFAEVDMPEFRVQLWQGFLAPAKTDKAIIQRLNAEINAMLSIREVRDRIAQLGGEPVGTTPERFAEFIQDEISKWSRTVSSEMKSN